MLPLSGWPVCHPSPIFFLISLPPPPLSRAETDPEQEIMTMDEMASQFDLDRIRRSPAAGAWVCECRIRWTNPQHLPFPPFFLWLIPSGACTLNNLCSPSLSPGFPSAGAVTVDLEKCMWINAQHIGRLWEADLASGGASTHLRDLLNAELDRRGLGDGVTHSGATGTVAGVG